MQLTPSLPDMVRGLFWFQCDVVDISYSQLIYTNLGPVSLSEAGMCQSETRVIKLLAI